MTKIRKFSKKVPGAIGTILITALLALFFFQQNILVKQRNSLEMQTKKIANLSIINEELEVNFIEKNNFKNIRETAEKLNFTKAEKIHYIKVLEETVVAR